MSLFKTHDLWSHEPASKDEECGFECLDVANIDNNQDGDCELCFSCMLCYMVVTLSGTIT